MDIALAALNYSRICYIYNIVVLIEVLTKGKMQY
jgi:hypothetical protein